MATSAADQGDASDAIGAEEAQHHLTYIQAALDAADPAARRRALGEGFLLFGLRFSVSLRYLAEAHQGRFQALADAGMEVLADWLGGSRLTDRADEDERRVTVAATIAEIVEQHEGGNRLLRLAAGAILALPVGHPRRDVDGARRALLEHLEYCRGTEHGEGSLLVIADLLSHRLESLERSLELVDEGMLLVARVDDPVFQRRFLASALGYFSVSAIIARDQGDDEGQHQWISRAETVLDRITGDEKLAERYGAKNLLLVALVLEIGGRGARAADTYALASQADNAGSAVREQAGMNEGRLRLGFGEYARVADVLLPLVPAFEAHYLTAVEDAAITSTGNEFSNVVMNLAFALARLDRWVEAVHFLERGKSLRLRHRAALRATPAGERLLELEAELHAVSRGVPLTERAEDGARVSDRLASAVTLHRRVLEEYRQARPTLDDAPRPPTIREIAERLAPDEAVTMLGLSFTGTLLATVFAGDDEQPGGRIDLTEWTTAQTAMTFAGDHEDGWLYALEAPELGIDPRAALDRVLIAVDAAVGRPLAAQLHERGVRRVTIVPHRWLHLVPFWALPSLADFEVVVGPSAAHFVATARSSVVENRQALVVSDPTLDLPLSPAEVDAMRGRLAGLSLNVPELRREQATERALAAALSHAAIFHFCGHGRSNLIRPDRSALLVHPDPADLPPGVFGEADDDPFERLVAQVDRWHEAADTDEEERYADLAGIGRLSEYRRATGVLERRLEYGARGTLWGRYQDGDLVKLAEMWTAGDIAVQGSLQGCRLAFLAACEAGGTGLLSTVDESSGLPAALQLAGVATLVSSLWPVSDVLTALYVDLFYAALAQSARSADVVVIVRQIGRRLHSMQKEEAVSLLADLRSRVTDPAARFRLEAVGHRLARGPQRPFEHPYDWASFFVTGVSEIRFQEGAVA